MNLKELTLNDLKAMILDEIDRIQIGQNNINILRNEIAERSKETPDGRQKEEQL